MHIDCPEKLHPAPAEATLSWRWQLRLVAFLFIAVFLSRLPTFFRSVMDWDESLYFLMAEQWRAGHLPYLALWDNKPIGIYGIFALFQSGFGDDIASIRIASVVFATAAAFGVFRLVLAMPLSEPRFRRTSALFAATAYVVCSLTNDGLSANTETFMACFAALGMLAAVSGRPFAGGLLFGLAFMTKYVVLFEFPALAFAALALAPLVRPRQQARALASLVLGAGLPLLATAALYAATGHFQQWLEDSILSNFRRVAVPVSMQAVDYVFAAELLRWSPLFLISIAMLAMAAFRLPRIAGTRRMPPAARWNLFLALWLIGGCVGVSAAKSFFDHYFLQILPVMCVTLAWMVLTLAPRIRPLPRLAKALLFTLILALPLLAAGTALCQAAAPVLSIVNGRIALQRDVPARIAREIQPLLSGLGPNPIYVFDYQPIIYSLAGQTPPTPYAFPSVLTHCQLGHVAKVHAVSEVTRILAANPVFIIRALNPSKDPSLVNLRVYAAMDRTLAARYEIWRRYPDAVVYRLRAPDAPVPGAVDAPACP